MRISAHACQIISESLAFYYLEAERCDLDYKKKEIAKAVREVMDYRAEDDQCRPTKNPL